MKILWVNSATTDSFSHTELIEIPPVFQRKGDEIRVLVAGRAAGQLPDYYVALPMLFGSFKAYRLIVTLILPWLCLKYRPDVILTDWISASLTRLIVLARSLGLFGGKLIHDVRTVPVKEDGGKSRAYYAKALSYARRHFDGITTITGPLRDEICSEFGLSPDHIAVWASGVDVAHFHPLENQDLRRELGLENKFVVFYHGAVNENRGIIELAEAIQYLGDLPDLRLLIVGAGNQWDKLEAAVAEKQLDKVILKPSVPYSQIPNWIALADLCVVPLPDHPWWRVSSPLKLMEYLAMGKPVLLTEMRAHRAIIPDDEGAFYVSEARPEVFAEGIRRALGQRDRFAGMGEWGRGKAKADLTWEKQAGILRDYMISVLEGKVLLKGAPE